VFITNETEERFAKKINEKFSDTDTENKEKYLNVFLPTTPNPTSGFFLILPADSVKILRRTPRPVSF